MATRITQLRVRYAETDQMGVVYNANYLVWCEIGRTEFIREAGMRYAELERRGILLAVAEAALRYHAPARYDDPITIATTLTEVRSRRLAFTYEITNTDTGQRLVSASTSLIPIDRTGRPTALPTEVREMLERML